MQITYLGHSCFKLKDKNVSILLDPAAPKVVGLPIPKTEADVVTISSHQPAHDDLGRVKNEAFVIDSPGEYEIKDVSVFALPSFQDKQKTESNLIYLVEIEGVRVCHLGNLAHLLEEKQLEELDGVDVLLVNVGTTGKDGLSIGETIKLINQIEPSIVIPMRYRTPKLSQPWSFLATLDDFLKEYGGEGEKLDKLIINKSSLPEETKLVILQR